MKKPIFPKLSNLPALTGHSFFITPFYASRKPFFTVPDNLFFIVEENYPSFFMVSENCKGKEAF